MNAHHPLVQRLSNETDETRFGDWSQVLFDQALLAEGGQLEDPAGFVKRLNQLVLALEQRSRRLCRSPRAPARADVVRRTTWTNSRVHSY